ncbi:MAG: LON peptidase substrate-binding domain-containing protein [Actinomycetota bacterium]
MEQIGLFPLGIVLLPHERIPLHIFEDRYKELIGECLAEQGEFGLVHADESGMRSVGTRGGVAQVLQRLDDGRMNIVVEGRERFSIVRLTEGRSFQTAVVEPVRDEPGTDPQPEQVEACLEAVEEVADLAETEIPDVDPADSELSFRIAGRIDFSADSKQELVEMTSERERLERLTEMLDDAAETLRLRRLAEERARGNGQVEGP